MVKISSYNVNGIRAAHKKGFRKWIEESNPDIICIQETRASEDQIPEELQGLEYHAYHHVAEKKGYSGVSILSKKEPILVKAGVGINSIDSEGRILKAEYEDFIVYSVYAPSGTTGGLRQEVKMQFLDDFMQFTQSEMQQEKPVLFCGDFNICHTEIDIHNPKQNKNTSGFLIEERDWVSALLNAGLRDVFRGLHEEEVDLYSWWSYRANSKANNKGWRIDYHFATPEIAEKAVTAEIESKWDISDHAPVTILYKL